MKTPVRGLIRHGLLLGLLGTTALSSAAHAQLDEIVITAQKREQNLQEVPISVTALSGDALKVRQITDFSQLQFVVPGVTFQTSANTRAAGSNIRGIGTNAFSDGIESSVAMVIDGVVIGREGAGMSDFSDVERVEVLRGPQGTLFGKNASAGVISIVTKKPTEEFSAEFGASYGSFDEVKINGAVSGPIVGDKLLARISGYFNRRDGHVENVFPGAPQDKLNDRNEFGLRGKLEYRPNASASFLLSADYSDKETDDFALTVRTFADAPVLPNGQLGGFLGTLLTGPNSSAFGIVPSGTNLKVASDNTFFQDQEIWGTSLQADVDIGDHTLTSISAYRHWDLIDNNDADLLPLPLLAVNSSIFEQEQFSQEIRLASPSDQKLEYVIGGFFFWQEAERPITTQLGLFDSVGLTPAGIALGTDSTTDFREFNGALFGQFDYHLTDKLTVIGGVRGIYSDIQGFINNRINPGFVDPRFSTDTFVVVAPYLGQSETPTPLTGQDDDLAVTYRAGLFYDVTPDASVFATVSKGYKAAGFVLDLSTEPATPGGTGLAVVNPEKPFQIEAGLRSTWFDGRATFNVTGFYVEVKDFQAETFIPEASGGGGDFVTLNAGVAESFGVEAELNAEPMDGLSLNTSLAYTNATFKEFDRAPCIIGQPFGPVGSGAPCIDTSPGGFPPGGDFQDVSGGDLPDSPDVVVNFSGRYDHISASGPFKPFVGVGLQYRTGTITNLNQDPNLFIDDYVTVDFQAGITSEDGTYSLFAFGRNVNGADFVSDVVNTPFDTGGTAQFPTFQSERVFGVQFIYSR